MRSDLPLIGINLLYVRPGYLGGTVRYAHELLRHLALNDRYRWIIYVQAGAFPVNDPALMRVPRKEFRVIGGLSGRVFIEHVVLPWIAQRDGVDLLFSPGFVSPLWGRFHKVVTIHDLYYRRFPQFVRIWQRRYWQLFLPVSLRIADAVIADSDSTCADLYAAFPWVEKKVKRIHLGADGLQVQDIKESGNNIPFCLVVGIITPNKNIETIVSAFSILKANNVSCRLIVAGCDFFGLLSSRLEHVYPKPDIQLLEHVTDAMLGRLYASATCLIQASHYEGFGLPVVEAMMMGCPVVASDIPVLREIGGNAALYFPADSAEALSSVITKMVNEKGLRERLAEAGRMNASRFRWGKVAVETADLFNTVLEGKNTHSTIK